jgi:hypothetical protein
LIVESLFRPIVFSPEVGYNRAKTSGGKKTRMGMVRLLDLQLLYGDGGVDVFVGDQADPAGITVFQVKYFPNGLKASQKQQVRASFRQCRNNTQFGTREWILCVPLDLSQDEIAWFSLWSANEAPTLLLPARMNWWGETELGHLLLQPANTAIKEAFFPEEQYAAYPTYKRR